MLTDINVLKISDRCKHWNLDFANLLDRGHCGLSENQASNKDRNKKFISRKEAEKRNQKGSRWVSGGETTSLFFRFIQGLKSGLEVASHITDLGASNLNFKNVPYMCNMFVSHFDLASLSFACLCFYNFCFSVLIFLT